MRVFIIILVLVTLQNIARAEESKTLVVRSEFTETVLTVNEIAEAYRAADKQSQENFNECTETDSNEECANELGDLYN